MAVDHENLRCTFCGIHCRDTAKLVMGFGAVVCDGCVSLCRASERGLADATRVVKIRPAQVGPTTLAAGILPATRSINEACPFCDQEPTQHRRLFVADTASICSECIALCEDLCARERPQRRADPDV